MGCINSKATVHPASLDDDDDDVVVSRPSVSPPAQDGAGDAVAQLNEKIVSESTRESLLFLLPISSFPLLARRTRFTKRNPCFWTITAGNSSNIRLTSNSRGNLPGPTCLKQAISVSIYILCLEEEKKNLSLPSGFLFPFLDLLACFTHAHHPALRVTVGMRQAKLNGEVAVAEAGKASSEEAKPRLCFVFFF